MRILLDPTCGGGGPVVPSPTPPWANPPVSPLVQTCFGNDTIIVNVDTTYLTQSLAPVSPATSPYVIVLPNGTYKRQCHTIIIPGNLQPNTQAFKVTGTFNGFNSLLFNTAATSALLTWDGTAWVKLGGNAQESNS